MASKKSKEQDGSSSDGSKDSSSQPYLFGKMSKKFAQLTKLGRDSDLRKQIEDLERRLQDAELQKQSLHQELTNSRLDFDENKRKLEKLESQIGELSRQLGLAKRAVQDKDREHQTLLSEANGRQRQQIESLKCEHQIEIARLMEQITGQQQMETENKLSHLQAQYEKEIEELSLKCAEAVAELSKMRDEHAAKLNDVKCAYRLEIDSSTRTSTDSKDVITVSQDEAKQPIDLTQKAANGEPPRVTMEDVSNQQRDLKIAELEKQKELYLHENEALEEKVNGLQTIIDENSQAIVSLSVQLAEVRDECQLEHQKLVDAQQELECIRGQHAELTQEFQKKSELTTELESAKLASEAKINELNSEIEELKQKLGTLESKFETLEREKKVAIEEMEQEIEKLTKLHNEVVESKKVMQEKFEKDFEFLRSCNAEREQQLLEDYEWKLREIYKDSKNKSEKFLETQSKLKEDYDQLAIEKATQAAELRKNLEDAINKIALPEAELRQLRGFTEELQKGIKVASNQVDQMRLLEIRLREELRESRFQLQEAKETIVQLQKEVTETKNSCERRLKAKENNLKQTYDEQLKVATLQYNHQLKSETQRIKEDLEIEYNTHKLAALAELASQKDQEMVSAIKKYESEITELNEKLSATTTKLEETERRLTDEIELAKMSGNLKIGELKRKLEVKDEEFHRKEVEMKVKEKQLEDLQMQLAAHRATLDLVREEAEKMKEEEILKLKNQQEQEIGQLNGEWDKKLISALEAQSQSHKSQIHFARIELEKAMELSNQKEKEQKECISDLNEALNQRDDAIKALNGEIHHLQTGLAKMSKELEFHGREILRVRNEASRHLREASDNTNNKAQRSEDKIAIRQLREALLDKDRMVKKLQEEKKLLQMQLMNDPLHYKRLSSSQPVVSSVESPSIVVKRNKHLKEISKRLSAPILPNCDVLQGVAFANPIAEELSTQKSGNRQPITLQKQKHKHKSVS